MGSDCNKGQFLSDHTFGFQFELGFLIHRLLLFSQTKINGEIIPSTSNYLEEKFQDV